jgi:hypothetical protein
MLKATLAFCVVLFVTSVSGDGGCTAEDVANWSAPDFTERLLHFSLRKSTAKHLVSKAMLKKEKQISKTTSRLMPKALTDLGLSTDCTECYVLNVICTYDFCASVCIGSPTGERCRECNRQNCLSSLLDCVGPEAAAQMPDEPSEDALARVQAAVAAENQEEA